MNAAVFPGSLSGQVGNLTAVVPLAEPPSGRVVGGHGGQSERVRGRVHRKRGRAGLGDRSRLAGDFQRDIDGVGGPSDLGGGGVPFWEQKEAQGPRARARIRVQRTSAAAFGPVDGKGFRLFLRCDWTVGGHLCAEMSERRQTSAPPGGPAHCLHHQRRAPATPPLPLRRLQLVPKRPETPVVFRDSTKVRGRGSGARDSWPGAGSKSFPLAPPFSGQPVIKAGLSAPPSGRAPSPWLAVTPHPHWSVPVITPTGRRGSEATMMALLLFCHR